VAARSKAWIVFARTNTGVVGSNPTQDMDFCVRAALCAGRVALRRATDCVKDQETDKAAKAQQKAVETQIDA
jgi:hypothetical protein